MELEIDKIIVKNRFRKEFGDLEPLKKSISEIGLMHPVVINEDNQLIAGERRLRATKELGWKKIPITKINLKEIIRGEFDENNVRKEFTISEKVAIWDAIERLKGGRGKTRSDSEQVYDDKPIKRASQTLGISTDSLSKAKQVIDSGKKELIEKMDTSGKIDPSYKEIVIEKKKEQHKLEIKSAIKKIDYKLINGDLFEKIKDVKQEFDLIYVDPPYNILEEDWDKFSEKEFKEFTCKWLDAVLPLLKDTGRLYVNFSQREMFNFRMWMEDYCKKYDLIFTNMIIWNYRNNVKPHSKKGYKYSYEPLFYFRKKNAKDLNDLPEFGEERLDVWTIATPQSNYNEDKKEHPSQKPKELLRRIILTGCNNGAWILDPFAGIGTTGIVAKEYGKNFVLIERDKEYFKILKRNIEDE